MIGFFHIKTKETATRYRVWGWKRVLCRKAGKSEWAELYWTWFWGEVIYSSSNPVEKKVTGVGNGYQIHWS